MLSCLFAGFEPRLPKPCVAGSNPAGGANKRAGQRATSPRWREAPRRSVRDRVELVTEQMAVTIERERCRRVAEHRLYALHRRPGSDRQRRRGVAKLHGARARPSRRLERPDRSVRSAKSARPRKPRTVEPPSGNRNADSSMASESALPANARNRIGCAAGARRPSDPRSQPP